MLIGALLAISAAVGAGGLVADNIKEKRAAKERRHISVDSEDFLPPVREKSQKEIEADRKREERKAQARRDVKTWTETLADLDLLMDAARRRYSIAQNDAAAEKALKQVIALRQRISSAVAKLEKAERILRED